MTEWFARSWAFSIALVVEICSWTFCLWTSLAETPVGTGCDSEKTVPILAPQFWHSTRPIRIGTPHSWHIFDIGDIDIGDVRTICSGTSERGLDPTTLKSCNTSQLLHSSITLFQVPG